MADAIRFTDPLLLEDTEVEPTEVTLKGKREFDRPASECDDDSSKPLSEFLDDAEADDLVTFKAKHGRHFLVRWSKDHQMVRPASLGSPDWKKKTQVGMYDPEAAQDSGAPDAFFVYCVRPRGRRTPGPVSVGRSHRCDVWIADMSVSTHHAEIEFGDNDAILITDRGSTNGTFIGNDRVDFGDTASIPFGKTVKLGSVRLTSMPAQHFVDFVKLMAKQ